MFILYMFHWLAHIAFLLLHALYNGIFSNTALRLHIVVHTQIYQDLSNIYGFLSSHNHCHSHSSKQLFKCHRSSVRIWQKAVVPGSRMAPWPPLASCLSSCCLPSQACSQPKLRWRQMLWMTGSPGKQRQNKMRLGLLMRKIQQLNSICGYLMTGRDILKPSNC